MWKMRFIHCVLLTLSLFLTGCEQHTTEKLNAKFVKTQQQLALLEAALHQRHLDNARKLSEYSHQLAEQQPEFAALIRQIATDATPKGPLFLSLKQRFEKLRSNANNMAVEEKIKELEKIYIASAWPIFNEALSDPLNVLADLSGSKLPRINAEAAPLNLSTGEQLIGNPLYGQWVENETQGVVWQWYGLYALLQSAGESQRIRLQRWAQQRNYSYFHDYGSRYFTSIQSSLPQFQIIKLKQRLAELSLLGPYQVLRQGAIKLHEFSRTNPSAVTNTFRLGQRKFNRLSALSNQQIAKVQGLEMETR